MAFRKSHRIDGRGSSSRCCNCCSSVAIALFMGFCLVGVWMLASSYVSPSGSFNLEAGSSTKGSSTEKTTREPNYERDGSLQKVDLDTTQRQPAAGIVDESNEQDSAEPELLEEKNSGSNSGTTDEDAGAKILGSQDKEGQILVTENIDHGEAAEFPANKTPNNTSEVIWDQFQSGSNNAAGTEPRKENEGLNPSYSLILGSERKLCNTTAGPDYIPCLDNEVAIRNLPSTKHYEHRERHCPKESPTCLVPLPQGYKLPLKWPQSREKIWYANAPHTKLVSTKGHQNWVKETGKYLVFPGGGTQFKLGALHYIDFIQKSLPEIAWGRKSRVVLDVGCGVASLGGFFFERNVLTMSFAPKDEHEAQVQFALERGIPAVSAVMGTKRLPFPSMAFDVVHCARCRVPWHIEGGILLLELNRLLRPGGYFVWSATPVYQKSPEDVGIWKAMSKLTKAMCWELVTKKRNPLDKIGLAIYRKPSSNDCYKKRIENNPPLCSEPDNPDAAWNVHMQACLHRIPVDPAVRGSKWPEQWPSRLKSMPYWLNSSLLGHYGKATPQDFKSDYEHWKRVVGKFYLSGLGIDWSAVRNVMDMRSVYGGFAAALRDIDVWVMNVVPVDSSNTLPIIYERGLFGIYHDWCESFSTYPRSYDLLHADHLFSGLQTRCSLLSIMTEADRILRPEGKLIIRDHAKIIDELEVIAGSSRWEIRLRFSKENEGILCLQKSWWRPQEVEARAESTS